MVAVKAEAEADVSACVAVSHLRHVEEASQEGLIEEAVVRARDALGLFALRLYPPASPPPTAFALDVRYSPNAVFCCTL